MEVTLHSEGGSVLKLMARENICSIRNVEESKIITSIDGRGF